jgi:hypothetical protein
MIALAALALATAQAPPGPAPQPAAQAAPPDNLGGAVQVIAGFNAAEAERGPLDGRWRVTGRGGEGLYLIQLADPDGRADANATAPGAPEGAWLDLRRAQSLEGAGYLAAAKREGARLTLVFFEGAGGALTIELRADGRGGWRGDLVADRGRSPVAMRREPFFAAVSPTAP